MGDELVRYALGPESHGTSEADNFDQDGIDFLQFDDHDMVWVYGFVSVALFMAKFQSEKDLLDNFYDNI